MVARRSSPDSAELGDEKSLRHALIECKREVEALRAKLDNLNQAAREVLSAAAHAIRSPLTVTHSYLEILDTDLGEGLTEEQRSFVGIAHENIVKLRQLVDDLVDLAALETGAAQIDLTPVSIDKIIDSIRADALLDAVDKDLELRFEVEDGLPAITIDEDRLRDVLRRLLDNAVLFTPAGGSIRLRAESERGHLTICVEDNGVGIPSDRLADAYQPFSQLHRRPGEERSGFGLGLPLCRRQVEVLGGTLELASVEGQGTTATVRIPFDPEENG